MHTTKAQRHDRPGVKLLAVLAFSAFMILVLWHMTFLLQAKEEMSMLDKLHLSGPFTVTLKGRTMEAYLSKKPVLYFEWHYGEKGPEGWGTFCTGYRSEESLRLVTPEGEMELPVRLMRPYLGPSFSKTYGVRTAQGAPPLVLERIRETGEPVTVEEYCIEPGRTYYAQAHTESCHLPPGDGEKPSVHHNPVLMLSDMPFKEGKPQREITPGYQGWTY